MYQKWPDKFKRSKLMRATTKVGVVLSHFKLKTGQFMVFVLQNDANAHGSPSLQFDTWGRKKSLEDRSLAMSYEYQRYVFAFLITFLK